MARPDDCCSVVELRRYTLRPGRRDALIELFDGELLDPQEAAGMHVVGQFRDLDDPGTFVWLRGFRSMEQRRRSLEAFYYGPVWKQHRDAANATMRDSDDVLLLRPISAATRAGHGHASPAARSVAAAAAKSDGSIRHRLSPTRRSQSA
ncbi:MAG TPA: NIPSNAP family protein [Mycobacteriales bacterium]|nr:NIPSNAP family protein [Mycobacteriales bacterium]